MNRKMPFLKPVASNNESEILRIFLEILIDGPYWKKGNPEETAIFYYLGYIKNAGLLKA